MSDNFPGQRGTSVQENNRIAINNTGTFQSEHKVVLAGLVAMGIPG
jgi:hypothetical protein